MASPAKMSRIDEGTIEGFIFAVSPRKLAKNGNPYFTAVIQSARGVYHKVVVFSMDKQATFTQAAKNDTGVKLRNVKRSISFSDPTGFDVLCSRQTSVEVTTLAFLRCEPPSCKRLTIAEVKALGPKQHIGEVRGTVKDSSVFKVVPVNGSDCELKEVVVFDGTGNMKVSLWGRFANTTSATKSYSFKNVCTRDRCGCIYLSTSPSSVVEEIADLKVTEDDGEGSLHQESRSTTLLCATIKGVEVAIQHRCPSCHARQGQFQEKGVLHRCEGCRLKQSSLAYHSSFSGKAIVGTETGEDTAVILSSALSAYLRGAGLWHLSNDAEAIEDHLLHSARLDLTVNADGFLESMQRAADPPAPSEGSSSRSLPQRSPPGAETASEELLLEMLELAEVAEAPACSETTSGSSST